MADSTRTNGDAGGDDRSIWKAGGLGLELTGSIVGMAAIGWLIDRWAGTSPRWVLILLGVGVIGGGYNFIRHALRLSKESSEAYRRSRASRPAAIDEPKRGGETASGMFERKAGTWDDDDESEPDADRW